jgi:predicted transcriptional regulator
MVDGCKKSGTENKSYCVDHIERSSYAGTVLATIALRESERLKAARRSGWKFIDVNGSRSREILENLAVAGAQTLPRLGAMVDLDVKTLGAYLTALERAGRVKTMKVASRRGAMRWIVMLIDKA